MVSGSPCAFIKGKCDVLAGGVRVFPGGLLAEMGRKERRGRKEEVMKVASATAFECMIEGWESTPEYKLNSTLAFRVAGVSVIPLKTMENCFFVALGQWAFLLVSFFQIP